jgi:hypothetical protein
MDERRWRCYCGQAKDDEADFTRICTVCKTHVGFYTRYEDEPGHPHRPDILTKRPKEKS